MSKMEEAPDLRSSRSGPRSVAVRVPNDGSSAKVKYLFGRLGVFLLPKLIQDGLWTIEGDDGRPFSWGVTLERRDHGARVRMIFTPWLAFGWLFLADRRNEDRSESEAEPTQKDQDND